MSEQNSQQEHTNSYDLTEIEPGGRLPGSLNLDGHINVRLDHG